MVPKLRSLNWLSNELGVDRASLGKALKDLSPDNVETKGNGENREWFTSRVYAHLSHGQDLDYTAERARLAKEQADKTEMENKVRRGELLETEALLKEVGGEIHAAKTKLLGIPAQLSQYLAHKEALDVEGQLSDAIHDALAEISGRSSQELDTPEAAEG